MVTTCLAPGPLDIVEAVLKEGKRIGSILPRKDEWWAYDMTPNTPATHFPFPHHNGEKKLEILEARLTARKTAIEWLVLRAQHNGD